VLPSLAAAPIALSPWALVWFGAAVNLLAGLHYTYSVVRAPSGEGAQPKPNPVSWGIWSLSGWLAFAGQLSEGVRNEALLTLCVAAVPTFIFFASMVSRRRYGAYAPVSRLDIGCGVLALITLVIWRITASGTAAVALSILCDALVAIPVVRQAYRDPRSDSPSIWVAGALNAVITLATFRSFTFLNAGFGLYFLALCLLVSFLLVVRPRLGPASGTGSAGHLDAAGNAAKLAGAFAADYLTWDEERPDQRATALTRYIAGTADANWGWSGRGRQRADLVVLEGAHREPDGYYVVDVRVCVVAHCSQAPPTIVDAAVATELPNTEDRLGEEFLEIPLPGSSKTLKGVTVNGTGAARWFRLQVPVVDRDGSLCIPT
jgi:hypothetical protein